MLNKNAQNNILLFLIITLLVVSYFVFKPFLTAFLLAVVFSVVFTPLHNRILRKFPNSPSFVAFVTAILIAFIIIVPVTLIGNQLVKEATGLYQYISSGNWQDKSPKAIEEITLTLQKVFPDIVNLPSDLSFYAKQTLELLVSNFAVLFSSVAKLFLGVFIFAMSLYYLLKDGNRLRKVFILISPFADSDDEAILQKLHLAVNSVFKGNLTIALVQAVLTALGFAIFGVPNFVLWGTLAGICALIPTVGTSLVLVPGIIYLLLNGLGVQALGLFLWGVFAVGLVDNFLGPRLVGKGIAVHPLLVLFSVLGGISFFGPIGFILGPLFVSLFFALLEIYIGSIKNNINL
jgi:predicted PurR-regulated permease PerM